jgi:hypothetical protein
MITTLPTAATPMDFQNEQDRQNAQKHRIEQSLNYALKIIHHYIKDCIDLKYGCTNEADYTVWAKRVIEAESGRKAMVSAMRRLEKEYGFKFELDAEQEREKLEDIEEE